MASYRKVYRKDGVRVYELSVYRGRDPITKKLLSPYTKRWTPPENWSDEKCEREAIKQAHRFEIECIKRNEQIIRQEPERKEETVEVTGTTVRQYVNEYLNRMKMINAGSTYYHKKVFLGDMADAIGDMSVKDLSSNVLEDYFFKLFTRPNKLFKPSTKELIFRTVRHFIRYGQQRDVIPYFKMPSRECLLIRKEDKQVDRQYLSIDDIKKVLNNLEQQPLLIKALITLLIDTGCRIGEAVALRWDNVNLDTGEYTIRYNASIINEQGRYDYNALPKTGQVRTDYLTPHCIEVLREWERKRIDFNPNAFVFYGDGAKPVTPRTVNRWLHGIAKQTGIKTLHAHMFRHAVASIMLSRGIDMVSVSQKLGHSNPTTTMRIYAHAMPTEYTKRNTVYANAVYS